VATEDSFGQSCCGRQQEDQISKGCVSVCACTGVCSESDDCVSVRVCVCVCVCVYLKQNVVPILQDFYELL